MHAIRFHCLLLIGCCCLCSVQAFAKDTSSVKKAAAEIVSIHSAATLDGDRSDADIVRYKDHFYVAFAKPDREGDHVFHVLRSGDGREWEKAAVLWSEIEDRRPDIGYSAHYAGKPVWFSIMPSGRLCLTSRGVNRTVLWSTNDGTRWKQQLEIGLSRSHGRILWQGERAYNVADETLSCGERYQLFRFESADQGTQPKTTYTLAHDSHTLSGPRESQIAFHEDRAICLLSFQAYQFDEPRRLLVPDGSHAIGQFGVAKAPFTKWTWMPTELRFGQPNLLVLQDGQVVATAIVDDEGRGQDSQSALCHLDTSTGKLSELLRLPTGNADSVGMTEHDGHLWVSFYAEVDDKEDTTQLKVAKIKLAN